MVKLKKLSKSTRAKPSPFPFTPKKENEYPQNDKKKIEDLQI
jgi:hypothetical protein